MSTTVIPLSIHSQFIDRSIGNGTEDIVRRYQHPSRLFFFSVHLFDKDDPPNNFEFFPGSGRDDDTVGIPFSSSP